MHFCLLWVQVCWLTHGSHWVMDNLIVLSFLANLIVMASLPRVHTSVADKIVVPYLKKNWQMQQQMKVSSKQQLSIPTIHCQQVQPPLLHQCHQGPHTLVMNFWKSCSNIMTILQEPSILAVKQNNGCFQMLMDLQHQLSNGDGFASWTRNNNEHLRCLQDLLCCHSTIKPNSQLVELWEQQWETNSSMMNERNCSSWPGDSCQHPFWIPHQLMTAIWLLCFMVLVLQAICCQWSFGGLSVTILWLHWGPIQWIHNCHHCIEWSCCNIDWWKHNTQCPLSQQKEAKHHKWRAGKLGKHKIVDHWWNLICLKKGHQKNWRHVCFLKDIFQLPYGGMDVIFCGDMRQLEPINKGATKIHEKIHAISQSHQLQLGIGWYASLQYWSWLGFAFDLF